MLKNLSRFFVVLSVVGVLFSGSLVVPTAYAKPAPKPAVVNVAPAVKKSVNKICHAKGTRYYTQTKTFTAYKTLKDCVKSGGRLPKS
ncbi:hypothetical protein KBD34_01965 [Patescibacteria group bacterium]|nr:hypothetical protein [Patescibacteria group bacterium]